MAVNLFKRVRKRVTNHALEFTKQTVWHDSKYFANLGTMEGFGTDVKVN